MPSFRFWYVSIDVLEDIIYMFPMNVRFIESLFTADFPFLEIYCGDGIAIDQCPIAFNPCYRASIRTGS
jgi:hypothetical protein